MFYIYELIDPRTDETRYIGKTIDPIDRLKNHIEEAQYIVKKKTYKNNWINSLLKVGIRPILNVIDQTEFEKDSDILEIFYIALYKSWGILLTNLTSGGGGGDTFKNDPNAEARRLKISIGCKKRYSDPAERLKTKQKAIAAWTDDKKELARLQTNKMWESYNTEQYKERGDQVKRIWKNYTNEQKQNRCKNSIAIITRPDVKAKCIAASVKAKSIPICEIDENYNVIREYKSAREASRILNISATHIWKVLNNINKTAHGKRFKYK